MPTEKQLNETLEKISQDTNGFIAASLVDLDSGMTLAIKASRTEFDLTAASAYNSELVKQKLKIMRTLGLSGTIEDMLITLTDQIHLVKLVGPNTFLYLAVDKKLSNIALVRTAVNRHANALTCGALPQPFSGVGAL
jgi:predicted regulator of Ras-like GTPase activity (Roadblock/LC7/MglB family)